MDAIKLFRALIQANLALLVFSIVISFFAAEPPEAITEYLDGEGAGPLFGAVLTGTLGVQIVVVALMIGYLVAWIASMIFMLSFRPWARTWYIGLTIAGFPLVLLAGANLVSPFEGMLEALLNACSGALLVLLFIEPVRNSFESRA